MNTDTPVVLITGAAGNLGTVISDALPEQGWRVRRMVRTPEKVDDMSGVVIGDVTDLPSLRSAMEGVSAVIHMGGLSDSGDQWQDYLTINIDGTRNVLEAARIEGIERVALASSNHAAGYHRRGPEPLSPLVLPRPDSFYGVSKAAVEALGSFYSDEYGMSCSNLRIGSCFPEPESKRMLATWLSYADLIRLVTASLTGTWEGCATVWGISRNTRRWWSLEEGERIGFHPEDDSEVFAHKVADDDSGFVGGDEPPEPEPVPPVTE